MGQETEQKTSDFVNQPGKRGSIYTVMDVWNVLM
jgi:hypothetical protein